MRFAYPLRKHKNQLQKYFSTIYRACQMIRYKILCKTHIVYFCSSFSINQFAISKALTRLFANVICDLYLSVFSLASKVFIVSFNLCKVESICRLASFKSSLENSTLTSISNPTIPIYENGDGTSHLIRKHVPNFVLHPQF